ncbi:MAG: ARMT1-like domain-containing protein [bacterium]|nr:ARMT1-like domain-containing protein [bacterium]
MKIYPECIPCFFQQALTTLQMATQDNDLQLKGLKEIAKQMPALMELPTPTHVGRIVHNIPKLITNNHDPYKSVKAKHTKVTLRLYPKLKKIVENSGDPLFTALKVAVSGNIIDFGRGERFNIEEDIEHTFNKEFVIFDYNEFKIDLQKVTKILWLADNAGETVLDKLLIEELNKPVIYAVRGVPVLNDATIDDAISAGIDKVAELVNSGTDAPGIILEYCNHEFRELFAKSELVLSKGQGNYETLSETNAPIYFLFKAKCPAVAEELGVNVGDIIFKKGKK